MKEFNRLIQIMKKLRNPAKGCPWDLKQTEKSLTEYIIEEAYELCESIDAESTTDQIEELGDLLLQIVFISQIHEEKHDFSMKDVCERINRKLVSRHPHIFSRVQVKSAEEVKSNWEKIKKEEKKSPSIISDYPDKIPALMTAKRIAEQAASIGFDWQEDSPSESAALKALAKVEEEIRELRDEIMESQQKGIAALGKNRPKSQEKTSEEIGDVLFAVANVARHLQINPEFALKKANAKFKRRFRFIETELRKGGKDIQESSLEEMEALWQRSKKL